VTSTERLSTTGTILFDGHVGITKANNLFLTTLTSLDHKLFGLGSLVPWAVASHLFLVDLCSHYFLTLYLFFFFQEIGSELVFFLAAEVHMLILGRQAG